MHKMTIIDKGKCFMSVYENNTRIKDGSWACCWIESQCTRWNINNCPTNPNCLQVHIVQWWSSGVSEQGCVLDSLGLSNWAKPQRPRKVEGLEARQAIWKCGLVQVLGLG